MRDIAAWTPTKFEHRGGQWRPSRDRAEFMPASVVSGTLALEAYCDAIRRHARGHLADLGCGKVPLYGFYKDFVDAVTCIDWPASTHASRHIDVYADLNAPIDVASETFDTILSSSVLEHIWRHDVFWAEMSRTLRPGGHVILGVPFVYWLHEEPHDYFRWTRHALAKACEENGLSVVSLTPYGGGVGVLVDLFTRALGAVSLRVAGIFGRTAVGLLPRRPSAAAEKLPLGYMLVARRS